jgi:hypothetical protein
MLKALAFWRCSHEFGWPRRDESGRHYQVCLRCGMEYAYDWQAMRRLETTAHARPQKKRAEKPHLTPMEWKPRERRLVWHVEIQYRRSGIVFECGHALERHTQLDMILEMPTQITGQEHSKVLCQGTVVRSIPGDPARMAIQIDGYIFLHDLPLQGEQDSLLTY